MPQKQKVIDAANKKNKAEIKFYENDPGINHIIKDLIDSILKIYNRMEISDIIYTCIKELIINATKANLKRAFFQKNKYDINDLGQYISGLVKFKQLLDSSGYREYFQELHRLDLWVKFIISHSEDGVCLEINNNSEIAEMEEKRIRMKLNRSMIYDNLIDYYNNEKDDSEGEGLGTALIVMLMEKARLDPHLFRIGTISGMTVSRIEIPFTSKYIYKRKL